MSRPLPDFVLNPRMAQRWTESTEDDENGVPFNLVKFNEDGTSIADVGRLTQFESVDGDIWFEYVAESP